MKSESRLPVVVAGPDADSLLAVAARGRFVVAFSGGEPMLHPQLDDLPAQRPELEQVELAAT